jgi:hypothetical protein
MTTNHNFLWLPLNPSQIVFFAVVQFGNKLMSVLKKYVTNYHLENDSVKRSATKKNSIDVVNVVMGWRF